MNQAGDVARLIQQVLTELGCDAEPETVAGQVRRLDRGLPAEDEFTAICSWLGNARLVHKLDQQQAPLKSRDCYQVPDLFVQFENSKPLLVEVKCTSKQTLSFKPSYLRRIRAYSELVNMPLLIAWKCFGMWVLFEARHFAKAQKNFNIRFVDAMRENLLGVLAGDVSYTIAPGAGVRFRCKKEELLTVEEGNGTIAEQWRLRIEEVGFTAAGGEPAGDLDPEVTTLFSTWDLCEHQSHSDTHVELYFVADNSDGAMFGHMALAHLLNRSLPRGVAINWRHVIRRDAVVSNMTNFSQALEKGLMQNVVRTIHHQRPLSWPNFLSREAVRTRHTKL